MTPVDINPGRAQAIQSEQEKDIAKLNTHIQLLRLSYEDALKYIKSYHGHEFDGSLYEFADLAPEMSKMVQDQISALPLLDPRVEEHKKVMELATHMIYDADNLLGLLSRLHKLDEVTIPEDWRNEATVDSSKSCDCRLHSAMIRLCGSHMYRFDRDLDLSLRYI
jgi:hypothetical protein